MKIESFKQIEKINDLNDEVQNMKEIQTYFEELVKQKSKGILSIKLKIHLECNDLRTELTTVKNLYEKLQKKIEKRSTLATEPATQDIPEIQMKEPVESQPKSKQKKSSGGGGVSLFSNNYLI